MKKTTPMQTVSGTLQQILFSPKGTIEGLLLAVRGKPVQISMSPGELDIAGSELAVGQRVVVKAMAEHSPKTRDGVHPVYKLESFVKVGKASRRGATARGAAVLEGVVAQVHYARHGQPNGVVLGSGDFIHMKPHGMELLQLSVGADVIAKGELRMTVLGTRLLEATQVNRVKIA